MGRKHVSYLRVSTDRQGSSGLGLEAQREAVHSHIIRTGGTLVGEFVEVESGKRSDRPQLKGALTECRRKQATLIVAKLDRLGRSVAFVSSLMESGVDFVAADNPHANKFILHVLVAFAEHERDLISIRTKAALQAARERGTPLGNPHIAEARLKALHVIKADTDARTNQVLPHIRGLQSSGITSLREIATALNQRGVATTRGCAWHPSSVRNVLRRAADMAGA